MLRKAKPFSSRNCENFLCVSEQSNQRHNWNFQDAVPAQRSPVPILFLPPLLLQLPSPLVWDFCCALNTIFTSLWFSVHCGMAVQVMRRNYIIHVSSVKEKKKWKIKRITEKKATEMTTQGHIWYNVLIFQRQNFSKPICSFKFKKYAAVEHNVMIFNLNREL